MYTCISLKRVELLEEVLMSDAFGCEMQRHDIEGKLTIWLIGVWWCGVMGCGLLLALGVVSSS